MQIRKIRRWLFGAFFGILVITAAAMTLVGYAAYRTPPPYLSACAVMPSADYPLWARWFAPYLSHRVCLWKLGALKKIPDDWFAPETAIGAVVNISDAKNGQQERDAEKLISLFQGKGIDVDAYNAFGLIPLHNAVMANNPNMTGYLLTRGANPRLVIRQPGNPTDGMNAYCFAVWLQAHARTKHDMRAVLAVLRPYKQDCPQAGRLR